MSYEAADLAIDPVAGEPSWDVRRTAETDVHQRRSPGVVPASGEPEGAGLLADHQTAGRGRLDRTLGGAARRLAADVDPAAAVGSAAVAGARTPAPPRRPNAVGIAAAVPAARRAERGGGPT